MKKSAESESVKKEKKQEKKRKLPKSLKTVLIVLLVLALLGGAGFLIVRQLIRSHVTRVTDALEGTRSDLYGLFADDELLQTLWRNGAALYASEELSFDGEAELRAKPHEIFKTEDPHWPLTLSGERDAGLPCCAGTLLLGTEESDTLHFSYDEQTLRLRMEGLGVYSAPLDALEEQGVSLPGLLRFDRDTVKAKNAAAQADAAGCENPAAQTDAANADASERLSQPQSAAGTRNVGSTRRTGEQTITLEKNERRTDDETDGDGEFALLRSLFEDASGMPAKKLSLETDGGVVECDHYQVKWEPSHAEEALEALGLSALRDRTLLLNELLEPDRQTLTLLWAAVRDGTVDQDGLLCAVVARLLLDFEPTAELYLAGDRVRGLDLTRKDDGSTVTLRLLGATNVLTHVELRDTGCGAVLEFVYTVGSRLELTLRGLGQTHTLLRYEESDGSFCIELGSADAQRLEGVLLPADDGLTLEYRSGGLLLGPIEFTVPLPEVEYLWIQGGYPPLEFSLQPTRLTLAPQRQQPQMLSGNAVELMELPLLNAVQIVARIYSILQQSDPLPENEALAGSYRLAWVERNSLRLDPSMLALELQTFTLRADGSCTAANLTLPDLVGWSCDDETVTLTGPFGDLTLQRVDDRLQYTTEETGITFVFERDPAD